MRVFDENCIINQLAKARSPPTEEDNKKAKDSKEAKEESPVAFLLILVRKFAHKHYEFLYIPASNYDRVEQVYSNTAIVSTHAVDDDDDAEFGECWIGKSCQQDDNNNKMEGSQGSHVLASTFESYYVGKAIFHTASGEPMMKIEGSCGWKEALKQKYQNLDAQSRLPDNGKGKDEDKNLVAAKAVGAAALGGGAAAGGASLMAATTAVSTTAAIEAGTAYGAGAFAASGGFGAGAGITTASAGVGSATGATTWASWAAANGYAVSGAAGASGATSAGGLGAAAQTAGAASVMATPVGMVAAAGAIGGLGLYYVMHKRNQAKKSREEALKEGVPSAEKMHAEDSTVVTDEEDSSSDGEAVSGYMPLSDEHEMTEEITTTNPNCWISLFAKRADCEDSHFVFVPVVCASREDAMREWSHVASNTVAKALFSPEGRVLELEVDPADRDGWETALALHFDFVEMQNLMALKEAEEEKEDSPLLEEHPLQKQAGNENSNWVIQAIRKKREQISQIPGPGAMLSRGKAAA